MGKLEVTVVSATNLPDTQWISKPDPYVIVKVDGEGGGAPCKTRVIEDQLNPVWNETFRFHVADPARQQLHIQLWNSNVTADEFLGQYALNLDGLVMGQPKTVTSILQQCKTNAEIVITLHALDFGAAPPPPAAPAAAAPPVVIAQPVGPPGGMYQAGYAPPPPGMYGAPQGAIPGGYGGAPLPQGAAPGMYAPPPSGYQQGPPPPSGGAYAQPPPPGGAYAQPPPPGGAYAQPPPPPVYHAPPPVGGPTMFQGPPPPGGVQPGYGQAPPPVAPLGGSAPGLAMPPPPAPNYHAPPPPHGTVAPHQQQPQAKPGMMQSAGKQVDHMASAASKGMAEVGKDLDKALNGLTKSLFGRK